ncbi:hypothetical protein [Paenibacillus herberti]|uniref:Uncharacterized protein n=1 Tax=Paenibacillus herberti TaxID=1619309 RepID=A0A229NZL7_9BACL|nr:hypothetical protein [Paenibacillus herberti]OXM15204.1 hypothetical protein CGZ75_00170 [Paenibacillus herberti]
MLLLKVLLVVLITALFAALLVLLLIVLLALLLRSSANGTQSSYLAHSRWILSVTELRNAIRSSTRLFGTFSTQ